MPIVSVSRARCAASAPNAAPITLSAPTPSGTLGTSTTVTLGMTTDQANGTVYGVVDSAANLSGVTAAQIKAGQNKNGVAAVAFGSSSATTTSPAITVTGLTAATGYSYALVQNNASGDSNLIAGTFTTATVAAFDYYIGPSGSSGNNGTSTGTPWDIASLNNAGKRLLYAGKRVGIMDGTYDLSAMTSVDAYAAVLQIAPGTASANTVIQAFNARLAILNLKSGGTRNSKAAIGHYGSPSGQGYTEIRDLVVKGGSRFGIQFSYNSNTDAVPGIIISGCEVDDIVDSTDGDNTDAIWLFGCAGAVISNNYLHNGDNNQHTHNASGVKLYGCQDIVVENNTISNYPCGIYPKGQNVSGTQIRYNYILDCKAALFGFYSMPTSDGRITRVHHNVVDYVTVTAPNNCLGIDTGYTDINQLFEFYNNTFDGPSSWGDFAGTDLRAAASGSIKSYNNIITGCSSNNYHGDFFITASKYTVLDYNSYSSVVWATGSGPTRYTTLANWRTASGAEAGSRSGSPGFVGTGSGPVKFKLDVGSACINFSHVGGVSGGASVNAGAYESAGQTEQIGCNF